MTRSTPQPRQHAIHLGLLLLGLTASEASASLILELTPTDLGGGVYQYDATVTNSGPEDFVIVSIVDAPVADPLIGASLTVPPGFLGSYDPGLGIVDFLEFTDLFAAGTTTSGFSFQSLALPDSGSFTAYQALTPLGGLETGTVVISPSVPVIPEPATSALLACGLAALATISRRRSSSNHGSQLR